MRHDFVVVPAVFRRGAHRLPEELPRAEGEIPRGNPLRRAKHREDPEDLGAEGGGTPPRRRRAARRIAEKLELERKPRGGRRSAREASRNRSGTTCSARSATPASRENVETGGNLVVEPRPSAERAGTAAKPVVRHDDAQKAAIPVLAGIAGRAERSGNGLRSRGAEAAGGGGGVGGVSGLCGFGGFGGICGVV